MRILKKQGIKFELNTRVVSGENHKDKGVKVNIQGKDGKERTLDTDICLLSIGRRPFTAGLQLEKAGLELNERGQIDTDDHLRTKVPHIWGIGDAIKGAMLAHKAEEEGIAVVETIHGK